VITRPLGRVLPAVPGLGTPLPHEAGTRRSQFLALARRGAACSGCAVRDGKKLLPCCEDSCHAGRREKKNGRWRGLRQGRPASVAGGQKRARKAEERTESADRC